MEKFLFVISKGFEKSDAATRALQLASITAEKGLHVEVFFLDDAIHWAQLGMAEGIRSTTGEHMKDLLDELISKKPPSMFVRPVQTNALYRRMIAFPVA
jgi:sulfur relay (sulfurtransferase) complex TusBCD TusD component (DsrE family)